MTGLAIPHFGDPQGIFIGWILRDHITQASRHRMRAVQKDRRERITLPGHRRHLADQAVHIASPINRPRET
jgi:hypothetical protein